MPPGSDQAETEGHASEVKEEQPAVSLILAEHKGREESTQAAVVPSASTLMAYAIIARAMETSARPRIPVAGGSTE